MRECTEIREDWVVVRYSFSFHVVEDTDVNRSWAGFASVYIAVFIVVVGVTTRSRPAAAPPTGDFDFGYHAIAYPTFMVGMTATATIFVSTAATSAFLPVISEMRVRL
jgi:hypothetical protein